MAEQAEGILDKVVLAPLEDALDAVGLMQGDAAPLKRAAVGAAIGAGIAYGLKPAFAFDATGNPKPFYFAATDAEKANSTFFPDWAIVALPAFVLGVLI